MADNDEQVYKVRCAATYACYLFVRDVKDQDQAEEEARKFTSAESGFDWESEASHMHTTYEVEEA